MVNVFSLKHSIVDSLVIIYIFERPLVDHCFYVSLLKDLFG